MNKIKEVLHMGGDKEATHQSTTGSNTTGHSSTTGTTGTSSTVAHSNKTDTELDWKHDPKHGHHTTGVATGGQSGDTYTGSGMGSGSGGAFDARDPTDSGRTVQGTQYNDRTGHTHPTTGTHHSTFDNDPTSASTGNDSHIRRPSMAPATSSALSVKSGIVGQPGGVGALSSGLPDRSLEHGQAGGFGHPHTTFTANLLDPAVREQNPTFHEEHVHRGGDVTHGHPEISTQQYANEHYDPSKGPDFLGRDVAMGGAGVGAAGLAAHELGGHHGSSTSGLGSSSTGYAAPTSGLGQSTSSGYGAPTSGLGQSSTSGYGEPTSHSSHHTGRDAGLVGAGLGAGALGASAYEHEQSGPAQRYNQATFGDSSLTGQSGQSVPGPTGSGHNILGSQHNQADSTGRGYQERPDFVGRDVGHSGLQQAPDQTGVYDKEHFSGGHFNSRANEARDPHTGAAGTLASEGLTAHEIKEHEKNQAKRDHQGSSSGGGLMSHFGSHSKPAEHHDDKMKHKNIFTPASAVSHEGERHRDGGYADTSNLTDSHTGPSGSAIGTGLGAGALGGAAAAHHGTTTPMTGSEYSSQPAGGNYSSGRRIDEGESTGLGGHAYPSSTSANVHPNFGSELPTRDPHHYYDHNSSSNDDYSKDGNSSFRRSGYGKGDGSSSASYNPMSANYGSSAAIGSTDGYESRQAAAQGLTHSSDHTTGLEGTAAPTQKSGGIGGLLHRDHPTKLHKDPKDGYSTGQ